MKFRFLCGSCVKSLLSFAVDNNSLSFYDSTTMQPNAPLSFGLKRITQFTETHIEVNCFSDYNNKKKKMKIVKCKNIKLS